ncbi:hypothetical protein N9L68_04415 [bacterium]|nr:hypothetical protein [bacterium]
MLFLSLLLLFRIIISSVGIIVILFKLTPTRTIVLTECLDFRAARGYGAAPWDYSAVVGRCASSSHGQGGHGWVQAFEVRVREDPHARWDVSKVNPAGL